MPRVEINLDDVQEKQPLPVGVPYTFGFKVARLDPSKDGLSHNVYAELVPEEDPSNRVFHRWSLKRGALEANSPTISIKKFFEAIGFAWDPSGFDTEEMLGIRFQGTVLHEPWKGQVQVRLASVLGAA